MVASMAVPRVALVAGNVTAAARPRKAAAGGLAAVRHLQEPRDFGLDVIL